MMGWGEYETRTNGIAEGRWSRVWTVNGAEPGAGASRIAVGIWSLGPPRGAFRAEGIRCHRGHRVKSTPDDGLQVGFGSEGEE